MIRVIISGSNSVILAGLVSILNCQPDLQVVGSFLNQINSLSKSDYQADLLLLEQAPEADSWWLEQWMLTRDFEIAGIILTEALTVSAISEYINLGFKGFLPRLSNAEEIIAAVKAVMAGLIVIHPELAAFNDPVPGITPLPPLETSLTSREAEILQLLGAGLENKAIASRLQISKHTVKFHISSILSKLAVSSRTEAVTLGLRQGLIRL
ncbi:MAG TPA: DNA-binding response regulator [Xenococcaceae cyanobacterium]